MRYENGAVTPYCMDFSFCLREKRFPFLAFEFLFDIRWETSEGTRAVFVHILSVRIDRGCESSNSDDFTSFNSYSMFLLH